MTSSWSLFHFSSWMTFLLKHNPIMQHCLPSSSTKFGVLCRTTSVNFNVIRYAGKLVNTAHGVPPFPASQHQPPIKRNPAHRINCRVIFSAWSHRFTLCMLLQKLYRLIFAIVEELFSTSDAAVSSTNQKLITGQNYLDCLSLLASRDIAVPKNRERYSPRTHLFIW